MEWKIGNIRIKNQVILAPMAGISNSSFISIVKKMGVGLAYTEMISAEAIVRGNQKTFNMLNGIEKMNTPIAIQLFGSDPETMANAAKVISEKYETQQNVFIDINMGCPVPKIAVRGGAGSALLKEPDKIFEIVKAVTKAVKMPVTVKIRTGWDEKSINCIEIAKLIEKAGASAIALHARTRSQGYSGRADWQMIKAVKESVKIPVIGNGDILSCYDAKKMLEETVCDAVMIGRGTLGNPWLIKECVEYLKNGSIPQKITPKEKIKMLKEHYELLLKNTNEKQSILEIRMHALWYIKGLPNSTGVKNKICKTKTSNEMFEIIDDYITTLP